MQPPLGLSQSMNSASFWPPRNLIGVLRLCCSVEKFCRPSCSSRELPRRTGILLMSLAGFCKMTSESKKVLPAGTVRRIVAVEVMGVVTAIE